MAILAQILKNKEQSFKVKSLSLADIEEHCLQSATSLDAKEGNDLAEMKMVLEEKMKPEKYRKKLILVFYKVGLVGLKTNDTMPTSWIYLGGQSISEAEIEDDSRVYVQPTFWRHFGVSDQKWK